MAYQKLIENISIAIESQFKEISTRYNFDYGDEFEIALCELLSKILPSKYGICRGFVVTEDEQFGGDDIIIYDKERFPTLRLLGKNKFEKKQDIPIEAVYAYIEAKHTLFLNEKKNGQSIYKAFEQVDKIKVFPVKEEIYFQLIHILLLEISLRLPETTGQNILIQYLGV